MTTTSHNPDQEIYRDLGLDQKGDIRLISQLEVLDGKVTCRLHKTNLRESQNYVAISYTWGPATEAQKSRGMTSATIQPITCNGKSMCVTENLYHFLCAAANSTVISSKPMWIDSISINQQQDQERSHQVNQMATIYKSAAHVYIWLGAELEDASLALDLLYALDRLKEDDWNKITPSALKRKLPEALDLLQPHHHMGPSWTALANFFQRSYFTRTWTIQEVIFGPQRTAVCGDRLIDWDCVARMSKRLTLSSWTRWFFTQGPTASFHQLPNFIEAVRRSEHKNNSEALLYSLIRFRRFEASDPRDKVYALLGLASPLMKEQPRLKPVYGEQSVSETYISAAIQLLEDSDHLLLLAHAERPSSATHTVSLPSWVPDWSYTQVVGLGVTGYTRFAAAGNLPRRLQINESKRTLAIRGRKLDIVEHVAESKSAILEGSPSPLLLSLLHELPDRYCTGQSPYEVLWRSLLTDTSGSRRECPADSRYAQHFAEWFEYKLDASASQLDPFLLAIGKRMIENEPDRNPVDSAAAEIGRGDYETVYSHSQHTRAFLSEQKYFGIGAETMESGDSLWIVAGSRVPLILRESGNNFHIVGGAYVHGFMHGKALEGDVPWVDLNIE